MANPLLSKYKSSSSSSSLLSKYTPSKSSQKPSKKKGGGFLGGIIGGAENALGDVRDVAVGVGPGVVGAAKAVGGDVAQSVEDTVRLVTRTPKKTPRLTKPGQVGRRTGGIVKAVGKSYADYYGPLAEGDVGGFLHNVYEHPLQLTLDAATLASLGLKGATAARIIPKKGGRVIELTTASGKTVTKPLARGEFRAQLQSLAAKAGEKVDTARNAPGLRAAKEERGALVRKHANVRAQATEFNRSLKKLKKSPERVATYLKGRYDRQSLDQYVEHLTAQAAKDGPKSPAAKSLKIITSKKVQDLFDAPTAKMEKVTKAAGKLGEAQAGLIGTPPEVARAAKYRPSRVAGGARFSPEEGGFVGGPSIEELQGRGLNPVYYPDVSSLPKGVPSPIGRGGGKGIPAKTANMRQNKATLQLAGQVVMDPAVLNESFLRSAKYAHYKDTHDALVSMARPVDDIPEGWTLVRKSRSDRVNPLDASRSDFEEWARQHLNSDGEWKSKDNGLTTDSFDDAAQTAEGKYLAVPEKVAKTMTGEFTRQGQLLYWMNKYPLRVWRALVLGLRPAYLVNNMVGNTLMYLVHSGRPEDLKQLAGAFKQFVKPSEGKQIDRILEKHFAGQAHGGFIATQMPKFNARSKVGRAASATVNAIPSLDRRWEQALRRAKVKAELKRHPGLKAHAQRMGRENTYFEKIAPELEKNPQIVTQVYNRVNDALGNYDNLSAAERNVMRNLFPFYAWYRAIAGVAAKLTIEQPLKVNILAHLGAIAIEQNLDKAGLKREDIPSQLLGFIPTKKEGDRVRGFNTSSINPYATVGQLADFIASAGEGPGAMGRTLPGANPLLTDIISYIYGQSPSGFAATTPGVGTLEGVPQSRLLGAAESTFGFKLPGIKPAPTGDTFNDRDFYDELLRYLGVPYARVSPSAAKRVAGP